MVAVASSTPTGRNFFSKFIFSEFICLTDFLSDLLIVKNPIVAMKMGLILYLDFLQNTSSSTLTALTVVFGSGMGNVPI